MDPSRTVMEQRGSMVLGRCVKKEDLVAADTADESWLNSMQELNPPQPLHILDP